MCNLYHHNCQFYKKNSILWDKKINSWGEIRKGGIFSRNCSLILSREHALAPATHFKRLKLDYLLMKKQCFCLILLLIKEFWDYYGKPWQNFSRFKDKFWLMEGLILLGTLEEWLGDFNLKLTSIKKIILWEIIAVLAKIIFQCRSKTKINN